jgi:hypothetical protein
MPHRPFLPLKCHAGSCVNGAACFTSTPCRDAGTCTNGVCPTPVISPDLEGTVCQKNGYDGSCTATGECDLCFDACDAPACHTPGMCNPADGVCSEPPPGPDGTQCTYGASSLGSCQAGECVKVCKAGQGGDTCSVCSIGTYSVGGNLTSPQPDCISCPTGKTTSVTGATSISQCSGSCLWQSCCIVQIL